MKSVAVILGSAFQDSMPRILNLERVEIKTGWGKQVLFLARNHRRPAYLLFRHGLPPQLSMGAVAVGCGDTATGVKRHASPAHGPVPNPIPIVAAARFVTNGYSLENGVWDRNRGIFGSQADGFGVNCRFRLGRGVRRPGGKGYR